MTAQHPGQSPLDLPPATRGLRPGQKVGAGRFALIEPLGEGGMSVVWKAADSTLGGVVALKFLPPEISSDPTAIEDLRRETAQTRRLSHPNIVRVYDLYEDVSPFIYMEYVEGHTLSHERVRHPRRVLPWTFLAPYAAQLCDGLEYAHREHVIHRDLKPSNLLLDARRDQLKLVDFGIARAVAESVTRVTQQRPADGTLVYMSCQQLNGEQPTPLDDIYSLGATLYELLSSRPPFHSGDTAWQIRYGEIPALSKRLAEFELENEIPSHVEQVVMACLARDPFKRPSGARQLAELLGLVEARPPTHGRSLATGHATLTAEAPRPATSRSRPPTASRTTRSGSGDIVAPTEIISDVAARTTAEPEVARTATPAAGDVPRGVPEARRAPRRSIALLATVLALGSAAALYFVQLPPQSFGVNAPADAAAKLRLYEGLFAWLTGASRAESVTVPPSPTRGTNSPDGLLTPPSTGLTTFEVRPLAGTPSAANPSATLHSTESAARAATTTPEPVQANNSLAPAPTPGTPRTPAWPEEGKRWTNALGMQFAPVPGTRVLFSVWETRRGDYQAFLDAAPAHRANRLRPPPFDQARPDEPAVKVSWSNAVAFCRWLTESERASGRLAPSQSYRLPSDQEWSAAVGLPPEAGKTLAERIAGSRFNDRFPWGSAWPPPKGAGNFRGTETRVPTAIARYEDGAMYTSEVGRYGVNAAGLADLSGNVWEWCLQERGESSRVARGGAWDTSDPRELRSAYRYTLTPGTELESLGFRAVLEWGDKP